VILDVGTGSGVLSIWAAQAGAAKVYAIEYTDMAHHARKLVEANGVSHIVEVIQTSAEDLELPCKVDIIISEWMGYFLLRESMCDSVIRARNKWLKPDGAMFPSHATMYFSCLSNEEDREHKSSEFCQSMNEWNSFSREMKEYYNMDMTALEANFIKEQEDYYIYSSLWTELQSHHILGDPVVIKRLDLNTCTIEDVLGVSETPINMEIPFPARCSGFAGWFTVDFVGSTASPVTRRVTLSTGPEVGYTHWGQQVTSPSLVSLLPLITSHFSCRCSISAMQSIALRELRSMAQWKWFVKRRTNVFIICKSSGVLTMVSRPRQSMRSHRRHTSEGGASFEP
jgi:type I protein arginine methyltransferase